MVIIIRPIVPPRRHDLFEEIHAIERIQSANLRELNFIPQGTTGLNNNILPVARPAVEINIGTDFNCICYEFKPEHAKRTSNTVVWIGHGTGRSDSPLSFPGIGPFCRLASYALIAATPSQAQTQTVITGAPRTINRIVFFTCGALLWVHKEQSALANSIQTVQTSYLEIEASDKFVYEGDLLKTMDSARGGELPPHFARVPFHFPQPQPPARPAPVPTIYRPTGILGGPRPTPTHPTTFRRQAPLPPLPPQD